MLINTFHPDPKVKEWVQNLPDEVKQNTMSTRILQDVCRNSDATLAEQVVNAIKAKRWEKGIALMVHGVPKIVKFKSWADWCGAYLSEGGLKQSPVWFFNKVTTELIGDESIEAAELLLKNMPPEDVKAGCYQRPGHPGFLKICQGNVLSHGPEWQRLVNYIEDCRRDKAGGDRQSEKALGGAHPMVASKVQSRSKEGLRRRLVDEINNEATTDKVRESRLQAIDVLDRGGSYRVACEAAGIECKQSTRRIFVQSDMQKMAAKVIEVMGRDHARELASIVLAATSNNQPLSGTNQ